MVLFGYKFEGPRQIKKDKVIDGAAVYVIMGPESNIVDVGQAGESEARLTSHERKTCWENHGGNHYYLARMPSDKYSHKDRKKLERKIRNRYNPPCG